MAKQLKQILDEENLDKATENLKENIQDNLKGDFEPSKYREFQNARENIITGGVTGAEPYIQDAKDVWKEVEEMEETDQFKRNQRTNSISNPQYLKVKEAAENYKFLYQQFVTLFLAENRFNEKVSSAIEIQRSRALEKQGLELIKDGIPEVISKAMNESMELDDLERKIEDLKDSTDEFEPEKVEELESRIRELEDQVSSRFTLSDKQTEFLLELRNNPEGDVIELGKRVGYDNANAKIQAQKIVEEKELSVPESIEDEVRSM